MTETFKACIITITTIVLILNLAFLIESVGDKKAEREADIQQAIVSMLLMGMCGMTYLIIAVEED